MTKKWTKEEEQELIKYVEEGLLTEEIANKMGRSFKSIQHRRADLMRNNSLTDSVGENIPLPEEKLKPIELDKLIIQTLKDELSNVEPYKASVQTKKDVKGDTLVIHLTDLHAGKIVKNQEGEIIYNEEIFRQRINRLCEQTLKLLDNNISKGVPIREVALLLTGDLCNGEGIYATQAYEQEATPPAQVMLVVDVITKLIVSLLKRNLPVNVYGIRGNHGRTGKDTDVASNWDIMVYEILDFWSRLVLKNPKLQIKFAETEHLVFNIRGHNFMIRHIAPEQADSPAGRVKINQWAREHNLEAIVYGHYHHAGIFDCDKIRVIRGGSTVGGDSLSDSMAKGSDIIQICFGVNEQRITTFIYLVDLGEK
jgi:predicted phosphodiesterase